MVLSFIWWLRKLLYFLVLSFLPLYFDMASVEQFNQFLQRTIRLGTTERYDIRKFNDGGNFLLVDTHGDYLVIERESADDICNLIFTDISTKMKNETD